MRTHHDRKITYDMPPEEFTEKVGEELLLDNLKNNMSNLKPWYLSRTLWVAVIQAVSGVLVAVYAADPALANVGIGALVKSVLDFYLRFSTTTQVVK